MLADTTLVKTLELDNCQLTCNTYQVMNECDSVQGFDSCTLNKSRFHLTLNNFTVLIGSKSVCDHNIVFNMTKAHGNEIERIQTQPGCEVLCNVVPETNKMVQCKRTDGSRTVTNVVYFIFR